MSIMSRAPGRAQRQLLKITLVVALTAYAFGQDAGTTARVSTGRQAVAAMADPSVSLILLEVDWISIYEADCPPNAPVLITRNLTLRGNAARATTLDMNFLRHKVRSCLVASQARPDPTLPMRLACLT